jgi:hypothetical protein
MAENQNQSVGSSGQTTSTTKPADPDPILKPDINDAEDKQQKQHEVEEKKKQSGQ